MREVTVSDMQLAYHYRYKDKDGEPLGFPAGGFAEALIGCFEHADSLNRAKLGTEFPDMYDACKAASLGTLRDICIGDKK